ncbi:MAG: METTL5 family protein [Candidatus Hydrothermarchaeales archaeon]
MSQMNAGQKLNKKGLEILLEKCEGYEEPKVNLEQYITPSHIAAEVVWLAYLKGDIEDKKVYDLGCGTGRLGICCALMGAREVTGFDADENALSIARGNAAKFSIKLKWVKADIKDIKGKCDTVIQNPPFGVHRKEADRKFLDKALEIGKVIYSMHKAETREFISRYISKKGFVMELTSVEFQLPYSYAFHRKPVKKIGVDIFRIEKDS